eukprot:NODE_269_length_12236_cov_0.516932.p9 type:complete len:107 gc:universal NODE_269_length_12236_cov_0.516932:7075-6755(-)
MLRFLTEFLIFSFPSICLYFLDFILLCLFILVSYLNVNSLNLLNSLIRSRTSSSVILLRVASSLSLTIFSFIPVFISSSIISFSNSFSACKPIAKLAIVTLLCFSF